MQGSIGKAVFQPGNLAMLLLAFVFGGCAAWWLLPVGLALWLVMVVNSARDSE